MMLFQGQKQSELGMSIELAFRNFVRNMAQTLRQD